MATTLNGSALRRPQPAQRLRLSMSAVRVSFNWLGVRKSLTPEQKAVAAETFGATGKYLSAGKKLLDTKHPAFKTVTTVRTRARTTGAVSLPFPEPGVRLIPREQIDRSTARDDRLPRRAGRAVGCLDDHYSELKDGRSPVWAACSTHRLPALAAGMFGLEWDFPSTEPPEYLRQLSPELYEQDGRGSPPGSTRRSGWRSPTSPRSSANWWST